MHMRHRANEAKRLRPRWGCSDSDHLSFILEDFSEYFREHLSDQWPYYYDTSVLSGGDGCA